MHLKISFAKWRPFCPRGKWVKLWNTWWISILTHVYSSIRQTRAYIIRELSMRNDEPTSKKGTKGCWPLLSIVCLLIGPWEIWMKFWICNFQMDFSDWWLRHLLWNCPNMIVTGLHWWSVNIGSGNGLVPSGNKPLPEPMLTQISVAIWRH